MATKKKTAPERQPAPPRVQGVKRPPLKKTFIGNFLDKGKRPRRKLRSNTEVSRYILGLALQDLGGVPITGPNPETDEKIARMMASEIVAAINRSGADNRSARNWYTTAVTRATRLAGLMQPEITDDEAARALMPGTFDDAGDARTIMFAAMAITSQSVPVHENMRYALEQYRYFVAHGRFSPKAYGVKGSSIRSNLLRFNHILSALGSIREVRDFLGAEFTMREVKEAGAKVGIRIAGKEMADEIVQGSILFGPKIGSFYQNLTGNFEPLTMDLWFCRTWGRYTGTLVRDDVSPAQVERLAETLRRDFLELGAEMRESGLDFDPDKLEDYESGDLLALARNVHRFWETRRSAMVEAGFDNSQISVIKSGYGWPGAAESIIKSLSGTVDAPGSGGQRRWMRSVMRRTLQILARNRYPMTTADAQAILWFPEKDLYDHLANRKLGSLNVSYDEAMEAIARKEGFTDDEINDALRSCGDPQLGGRDLSGTAGPRRPEGCGSHGEGPRGQGQGPQTEAPDGGHGGVTPPDDAVEEPAHEFTF